MLKQAYKADNAMRASKGKSLLLLAGCAMVAGLAGGCQDYHSAKVGKLVISDPSQRHPIVVARETIGMKIPVRRGDQRLTDAKRIELGSFVARYRSEGEGRIRVVVPVGGANELAAYDIMAEIRDALKAYGVSRKAVDLKTYSNRRDLDAPIKLAFHGLKAHGPECGRWEKDLSDESRNLNYGNFGCAQQANLAAMIANPKDLVEPRNVTPRAGERRDQLWKDYISGNNTNSDKSADQKSTLGEAGGT